MKQDMGAPQADGLSQAEPKVSALRASIPSAGLRVLVCGGRDYDNVRAVARALRKLDEQMGIGCIIQGGARGADYLGLKWARDHAKPSLEFEARWNQMGKRAGHVRNGWMLTWGQPDIVVAFPGGRGTANMIEQAEAAGVRVWEPAAQAIEARSVKTEGLGPQGESAVRQDAPEGSPDAKG